MSKILVVLESPNKESKVQDYLGPKYVVTSSKGHIRDLDAKSLSIDIENGFAPRYHVNNDKEYVVQRLKKSYSKCTDIILATDYDREGESIAWHVAEVLNIPHNNRRRMIFTEITKKALLEASKNTKPLDMNIFYAQQARRLVDRLIGYKWLSPLLWKNIQSSMKKGQSLSGGRVQSVVNRLIIDREREVAKFNSENYFKTVGTFKELSMDLDNRLVKASEVEDLCEIVANSTIRVDEVSNKKTKRNPSTPFITSTLQQEASNKYRMSPKRTMEVAQRLYENGLITYMRTDSVTISEEILQNIKAKVVKDYGDRYSNLKQYKTKGENSQEAHEAIRPSNIDKMVISRDDQKRLCDGCVKLYNLIWRRTIASQMAPAEVNIQTIKAGIHGETATKYKFVAKSENILFDGFLKVYRPVETKEHQDESDSDTEDQLSNIKLEKNQVLNLKVLKSEEKFTRPPVSRFTEASLVKKLDEMGIGRPSTYASMVSIVQDRKYVERKDILGEKKKIKLFTFSLDTCEIDEKEDEITVNGEKGKLVPTDIGKIVNQYLEQNIGDIISYDFTINLEKMLDDIAQGVQEWTSVVQLIYDNFNPKFNELISSAALEKEKFTRKLGVDPYTGRDIVTYIAKYGPVVCLKAPVNADNKASKTKEKDKFVSLKDSDKSIETITFAEAVALLKYPYSLSEYNGDEVMICNGRYGLFFKYKGKNCSLKGYDEPNTIEDIEDYFKSQKEKATGSNTGSSLNRKVSKTITIKSGKYGPYIQYSKDAEQKPMFVNIGKADPMKISHTECMALINKKLGYRKGK